MYNSTYTVPSALRRLLAHAFLASLIEEPKRNKQLTPIIYLPE